MNSVEPKQSKVHDGAVPSTHEHVDGTSFLFETLLGKQAELPSHLGASPNQSEFENSQEKIHGTVLGRLIGIDNEQRFLIQCDKFSGGKPLVAVATLALRREDIGRDVLLTFIDGNQQRPVIIGLLNAVAPSTTSEGTVEVQRDDDRLLLSAEREIVLRCGESSITLTKAGKIIIRGKYLLSRAEGVNRIKGGAVQIN